MTLPRLEAHHDRFHRRHKKKSSICCDAIHLISTSNSQTPMRHNNRTICILKKMGSQALHLSCRPTKGQDRTIRNVFAERKYEKKQFIISHTAAYTEEWLSDPSNQPRPNQRNSSSFLQKLTAPIFSWSRDVMTCSLCGRTNRAGVRALFSFARWLCQD